MDNYGLPQKCTFTCGVVENQGEETWGQTKEGHYVLAIGKQIRKNLDERFRSLPLTVRAVAVRAWASQPFRVVVQKTPFENDAFLSEPLWAGSFAAAETPPTTEFLFDGESNESGKYTIAFVINKGPTVVVGENLKLFLLFYCVGETPAPRALLTAEVDFFVGHQEISGKGSKKIIVSSSCSLTSTKNVATCSRRLASASAPSASGSVKKLDKKKAVSKKKLKCAKGKAAKKKKIEKGKKAKKALKRSKKESMASANDIANRFAELQSQIKL